MSEWVQYLTLALNLLILPVMKMVWDVRAELIRLNGKVQAQGQRIERLERQQDSA